MIVSPSQSPIRAFVSTIAGRDVISIRHGIHPRPDFPDDRLLYTQDPSKCYVLKDLGYISYHDALNAYTACHPHACHARHTDK